MPISDQRQIPNEVNTENQRAHSAFKSGLTSVSYRSRATQDLSELEINQMLLAARARNRALGITGMLHLNNGRFSQWLEGPSETLARVWRSIRHDPRHTQIELISEENVPMRLFSSWDMKWVSPRLHNANQQVATFDVPHFTQLAIASGVAAMARIVSQHLAELSDHRQLYGKLIEPAARHLGDWWHKDMCSGSDVTTGLLALQRLIRQNFPLATAKFRRTQRRVLVTPQPMETHILGALLASDCFRTSGWDVTAEFPASNQQLINIVSETSFEAIIITLSDVYKKEDVIAELANLIAAIRAASKNQDLVVMVGGRIFLEHRQIAGALAGADAAYESSVSVVDDTEFAMYRRTPESAPRAPFSVSKVGTPFEMTLAACLPKGSQILGSKI